MKVFNAWLQILAILSVPRYMLRSVEQMVKHTAMSVQCSGRPVCKRRILKWPMMGNAVVSNGRISNVALRYFWAVILTDLTGLLIRLFLRRLNVCMV